MRVDCEIDDGPQWLGCKLDRVEVWTQAYRVGGWVCACRAAIWPTFRNACYAVWGPGQVIDHILSKAKGLGVSLRLVR